jgi:hypothetical protein
LPFLKKKSSQLNKKPNLFILLCAEPKKKVVLLKKNLNEFTFFF